MIVKQGDSSEVQVVTHKIDGVLVDDYSNYLLKMEVIHLVSKENAGVLRTIVPDVTEGFRLGLSPVDTAGLDVGEYLIVADLEETVGGIVVFNRELSWDLVIATSLRNN